MLLKIFTVNISTTMLPGSRNTLKYRTAWVLIKKRVYSWYVIREISSAHSHTNRNIQIQSGEIAVLHGQTYT